jgi:hypothetical protein
VVQGDYLQGGQVLVDSGLNHLISNNTIREIYQPTELIVTDSGSNGVTARSNTLLGGATQALAAGVATK